MLKKLIAVALLSFIFCAIAHLELSMPFNSRYLL